MGRAMVYISSVFAQLERETIAERVRDNMLQLAKTGRWLGGQEPFGFKSEKIIYIDENFNERSLMKLSPVKDELEVVKLIFDKYLETNSITQVTNYLQDNLYTGKNGGDWGTTQVKKILSSAIYVISTEETHNYLKSLGINVYGEPNGNGYLSYNKTRKMIFDRDITEWIYAVAKHKGVIDSKTWLMVQSILEKNKHKKIKRTATGANNTALLTGILKCSKCGSNMIIKQGHKSKTEEGKRYDYYVCSKKDNSRGRKCDNKNVRADRLDSIVLRELKNYNKDYLEESLIEILNTASDSSNNINKINKLNLEISEKETSISNLVKQLSSAPNEIVANYIMEEINKLSNDISEAKKLLEKLKENKETKKNDIDNLNLILDMLNTFNGTFDFIEDIPQKRLMLQTLLSSAIWDGENYEVKLNILEDKKK